MITFDYCLSGGWSFQDQKDTPTCNQPESKLWSFK